MPKIRLVEKNVVAPLTEKERSEVVTGLTNNPGGEDVILSGGADAAIRYYQNGQGGSMSLKEVGELLDEFFESIKDDYAFEEIVTIGTPHWSESLEGDIFPVKLRNKPMMYWVMYTDGYGKNVSRSTYSHAGAAEEAHSPKKKAADNLEEFYRALPECGYESFEEFEEELENFEGTVHIYNVAGDDEYSEWEESHGSGAGYTDHYFAEADKLIKGWTGTLKAKGFTGFSFDSDSEDTAVFITLTIDGMD